MKRVPFYFIPVLILALTSYFLFTGFSYQAGQKFAHIKSSRILTEYSEFVEARGKIDAEQTRYDAELKRMQDDLQTRAQDLEKKRLILTEEKRIETEKELNDFYTKIQNYGQEHFGQEGTIAKLTAVYIQPITEKVRKLIEKIGNEQGYDYIFDLDSQAESILYAKTANDITDLVLERLNKLDK